MKRKSYPTPSNLRKPRRRWRWWPKCLDLKNLAMYSGLKVGMLRGLVRTGKISRMKIEDPYNPERTIVRIYVTRKAIDEFIETYSTSKKDDHPNDNDVAHKTCKQKKEVNHGKQ